VRAKPLTPRPGRRDAALLGALCLFLSTVEYLIPKPLPFMRLGLANLPLILALDLFPFRAFMALVCLKALGQALVTGTLFSYVFLFSLAGTVASALSMYGLRRLCGETRIGVCRALARLMGNFAIYRKIIPYKLPRQPRNAWN
jgi:heptaprenyl diphosphate synthase